MTKPYPTHQKLHIRVGADPTHCYTSRPIQFSVCCFTKFCENLQKLHNTPTKKRLWTIIAIIAITQLCESIGDLFSRIESVDPTQFDPSHGWTRPMSKSVIGTHARGRIFFLTRVVRGSGPSTERVGLGPVH